MFYENVVTLVSTVFFNVATVPNGIVAIVPLEQTKSTEAFTHSSNKCYNIFTTHLFSIVVGYSFIFYYFILTYKKGIKPIFVLTFLHDSHFGP